MKLTNPEKLILVMLSEIYDKVGLAEVDTNLLRAAIFTENTWAIDWQMPGVVASEREELPKHVVNVVTFLNMWAVLEESHAGLSEDGRAQVERGAEPYGKHVRFPGFDGNEEARELSAARILIEDMDRFSRFKGRDLNSHVPLIPAYARMYAVFRPIEEKMIGVRQLSPDQMIAVLTAIRQR